MVRCRDASCSSSLESEFGGRRQWIERLGGTGGARPEHRPDKGHRGRCTRRQGISRRCPGSVLFDRRTRAPYPCPVPRTPYPVPRAPCPCLCPYPYPYPCPYLYPYPYPYSYSYSYSYPHSRPYRTPALRYVAVPFRPVRSIACGVSCAVPRLVWPCLVPALSPSVSFRLALPRVTYPFCASHSVLPFLATPCFHSPFFARRGLTLLGVAP